MRLLRSVLTAPLLLALSAIPAFSQDAGVTVIPHDTVAAMDSARRSARRESVAEYLIGGMASVPPTVVTLVALMTGSTPKPSMAIAPAVLIVTAHEAGKPHTSLPSALERDVSTADSTYAAVFRRTYDKTVSKRRGSATMLGGLVGIVGGITLLAIAFAGYNGD